MNRNKSLFVIVMLLISTNLIAQNTAMSWGVKGGVNFANLTDYSADLTLGFNLGLTLDYALTSNKDWYLITGLEYTVKGSLPSLDYTAPIGFEGSSHPLECSSPSDMTMGYLQLPIHVAYKLNISKGTRLNFHAGPYFAYGVRGKTSTTIDGIDASINTFGDGIDNMGVDRFDFGLGLGSTIEFGKFGVGVAWDLGLIDVRGSSQNRNISVGIEYKF